MHNSVDAVVSLGSGHPIIDIDLTVFLQFGLFVVMALLANRLLFQPYLALRERRKEGIEGARAEAAQMTATADSKLADYEKQLATARAKANTEGGKVRAEAAAHEQEVTGKARAAALTSIEEAQAKMRQETDAARRELMPQAEALAAKMATRLLGREVV
ncbi:MAG: ATP synthase F0 subunit B [Deltaproteobacteria bacterium]|nr:ATP synthase F0 subunit B [Deltaproteobacteria bacterium]MCW5803843.1 ATP synthase F0 subunit B [Deltaproteobacteria bacterium]